MAPAARRSPPLFSVVRSISPISRGTRRPPRPGRQAGKANLRSSFPPPPVVSISQIVVMDNQQYLDLLQSDKSDGLNDLSWSESQHVNLNEPKQPTPPVKASSKRQKNFSVLEDLALVDAYLEITQDPVIGVDQPRACYWKRIHDHFHANKKEGSNRNQSSLQHRWAVIRTEVTKFSACYAQIVNRNQSGMTQKDKITQACIMYQQEDKGKKAFALMHCYEKLQNSEKWTTRLTNKKQKTSSMSTPGSTSTSSSNAMEAFGGMLSAREEKRQERFDLAIAMDKQIEETRLIEERRKNAIEEKRVALEEEKIQLKRMMEERQIMNMDLSGMDEQQQEYYKMMRSQIISKHRNSSG